MCYVKKVYLEISQNSQENTGARVSFLIKLQALGLRSATLLKKRLWCRCFSVNFAKILRTLFFIEHLSWLLLNNFVTILMYVRWGGALPTKQYLPPRSIPIFKSCHHPQLTYFTNPTHKRGRKTLKGFSKRSDTYLALALSLREKFGKNCQKYHTTTYCTSPRNILKDLAKILHSYLMPPSLTPRKILKDFSKKH